MPGSALVVDCETTGLTLPSVADLSKQPRIIELGCAKIQDGQIVEKRSWLINPGMPISAEVTKVTGLRDEDVASAPMFPQLLPEIRLAFSGADLFIAHNAPFDKSCIEHELTRAACKDFPWPAEIVCTVQEYMHIFGRRAKLTDLYKHVLGRELKQTHRALDDVLALCEIVIAEGLA